MTNSSPSVFTSSSPSPPCIPKSRGGPRGMIHFPTRTTTNNQLSLFTPLITTTGTPQEQQQNNTQQITKQEIIFSQIKSQIPDGLHLPIVKNTISGIILHQGIDSEGQVHNEENASKKVEEMTTGNTRVASEQHHMVQTQFSEAYQNTFHSKRPYSLLKNHPQQQRQTGGNVPDNSRDDNTNQEELFSYQEEEELHFQKHIHTIRLKQLENDVKQLQQQQQSSDGSGGTGSSSSCLMSICDIYHHENHRMQSLREQNNKRQMASISQHHNSHHNCMASSSTENASSLYIQLLQQNGVVTTASNAEHQQSSSSSREPKQFQPLNWILHYESLNISSIRNLMTAFLHSNLIYWHLESEDFISLIRVLKIIRASRDLLNQQESHFERHSAAVPVLAFVWKLDSERIHRLREEHGDRLLAHVEKLRMEMEACIRRLFIQNALCTGSGNSTTNSNGAPLSPLCMLDPKKCVFVDLSDSGSMSPSNAQKTHSTTSQISTFDPFQLFEIKKHLTTRKDNKSSNTSSSPPTDPLSNELSRFTRKQWNYLSAQNHRLRKLDLLYSDLSSWMGHVTHTEQFLLSQQFNDVARDKILHWIDPAFSFSLKRCQHAFSHVFDRFSKKSELKKYRSNEKEFIQTVVMVFASYACGECMDSFSEALTQSLLVVYRIYISQMEEKHKKITSQVRLLSSQTPVVFDRFDRKNNNENVPNFGCPIKRIDCNLLGSSFQYSAEEGIGKLMEQQHPGIRLHTTKLKWIAQNWPHPTVQDKSISHRLYIGLLYHNCVTDQFFLMTPKMLKSLRKYASRSAADSSAEDSQAASGKSSTYADILLNNDLPLYVKWPKQLSGSSAKKHVHELTRLEKIFLVTPKLHTSQHYTFSPKMSLNFQDEQVIYDLEENVELPSNSFLEIRLQHNQAYSSLSDNLKLHAKLQRNYLVPSYQL